MDLGSALWDLAVRLSAGLQPPQQLYDYQVLPMLPNGTLPPPGSRFILEGDGNISESRFDATPWVDIGYPTQSGDLRALTIGGRGGTSEGDAWADRDISAARKIVGSDMAIRPRHVEDFKQYLRERRAPHFMSIHPGRDAY